MRKKGSRPLGRSLSRELGIFVLWLDGERRRLWRGERGVLFTPSEFAIASCLFRQVGRTAPGAPTPRPLDPLAQKAKPSRYGVPVAGGTW